MQNFGSHSQGIYQQTAPTPKSLRRKWIRRIVRVRWQGVCYKTVFLNNGRRYIHNVSPTLDKKVYEKAYSCIWREDLKTSTFHRKLLPFFFKDESYLSEQSFQKEIIKMTEK